MKKLIAATMIVAGSLAVAGIAGADPDFGPGNSKKGPHDPGAKCHPPGQTVDEPGCK